MVGSLILILNIEFQLSKPPAPTAQQTLRYTSKMISRYTLYTIAEISKRFSITAGLPKGVKPQYNISPTTIAPVIIDIDGSPTVKLMGWGLLPKNAKDTNSVFRYKTYNIPSETIFTKHSWDVAVRQSRCLIPANGFFELAGSDKQKAYYAQPQDSSLIAFAGVYSSWQDTDGVDHDTFSIITVKSNDNIPNSSGRMPIIIKLEDEARWLDPSVVDSGSLYDMLPLEPSDNLEVYEVSAAVHSPKASGANLIQRV